MPASAPVPCPASPRWTLLPDAPAADLAVEALYARAFGPGRMAKAAHRVREQACLERELSRLAAAPDGAVIGACRMWRTGSRDGGEALLLGPIAVEPAWQGTGVGRALARACVAAAQAAAAPAIVLVGDPAFFAPLGFEPVPAGQLRLPWPVDPARLMWQRPRPGAAPPAGLLLQKVSAPTRNHS